MQLIQLRLCLVLLIITILYTPEGTTADCDDWRLKGTDEVCCLRCSPGNLLVAQCGKDRTKLCAPCGPNTYNTEPLAPYCKTCTQCIDPQVQVKPCTASTDTVCGCKEGLRCGDQQCRYCVMECPKGEEPTYTRRCAKCPEGTFNDEIHSPCKPWRQRCPNGESMIANGTAFSDIKCSRIPVNTPSAPKEIRTPKPTERPEAGDNSFYALLGCFGAGFTLTVIIILSLWLAYNRTKNKSNSKDLKPTTPTQGELTIMMVEHEEACSFHQPEQEQGGSSESINTQNSETKLLV